MIDKILKFFGLATFKNLETMYDAVEECAYDMRITYDFMNDLLNHDLPPEVKIKINNYLTEHEWVEKNIIIVEEN